MPNKFSLVVCEIQRLIRIYTELYPTFICLINNTDKVKMLESIFISIKPVLCYSFNVTEKKCVVFYFSSSENINLKRHWRRNTILEN